MTEITHTRETARAFLQAHRTGVLSTLSPLGNPRARLVYFAGDADFNIYFMSMDTTRKAEDIRSHNKAAFVISSEEVPQTLQLEGIVEDITNTPAPDDTVENLFENLRSNATYFTPLARFDRGDIRFYRITPTWIRFGSFTHGHSSDEVFTKLET
jgi:general stress protein 26